MKRRTLITLTASAAAALAFKPSALAGEPQQKTPVVYPDPAVEVIDPRFAKYKVGNAAVERLYTGTRWAEGPVWFGDGRYLLWSDIPNNRILRWLEDTGEVSVFRIPSNYSNGNYRDRQGRLLTCEHDPRRLTRTEYDGTITVLIDTFQGKKLNAPNDLAVSSDGIRCDTDGNVWSAAAWAGEGFNGVHVFAPDGTLIGKIHLPETCANLCFGGAKKNRLFMAASQSLYSVYVDAQGAQLP